MDIDSVFATFVMILRENFTVWRQGGNGIMTLTEDTICFFLAAAFLQSQISASSIEMEVRYSDLAPKSTAAVDIYIHSEDNPIWIEVKLDKTHKGFHTRFGNLLNDICRLGLFGKNTRLMLYVAPVEMAARINECNSMFLGTDLFFLDPKFVGKLHLYTRKRLKTVVVDVLAGNSVSVRLIKKEEVGPLACLLYEVDVVTQQTCSPDSS